MKFSIRKLALSLLSTYLIACTNSNIESNNSIKKDAILTYNLGEKEWGKIDLSKPVVDIEKMLKAENIGLNISTWHSKSNKPGYPHVRIEKLNGNIREKYYSKIVLEDNKSRDINTARKIESIVLYHNSVKDIYGLCAGMKLDDLLKLRGTPDIMKDVDASSKYKRQLYIYKESMISYIIIDYTSGRFINSVVWNKYFEF